MAPLGNLNRLASGGMGLLGGATKAKTIQQEDTPFPMILDYNDGAKTADVVCTAGIWSEIWAYTILAGQKVMVGYGRPDQPQNQGHLYVKVVTA